MISPMTTNEYKLIIVNIYTVGMEILLIVCATLHY